MDAVSIEVLQQMINEVVRDCTDVDLLDLVYKILISDGIR